MWRFASFSKISSSNSIKKKKYFENLHNKKKVWSILSERIQQLIDFFKLESLLEQQSVLKNISKMNHLSWKTGILKKCINYRNLNLNSVI